MGEVSTGPLQGEPRHEERDVRLRPLIVGGVGLAAFAGAALLTMVWLFDYLAAHHAPRADYPPPLLERGHLPPEPRLQVSPVHDMRVMRAEENSVLRAYEWVDRQAGIVRIPIARAMELLTQKGEDQR
jgi:hypothetical protein